MTPEWALRIEEEEPAPMVLGERIKQLRKEAGWSQGELGERIGTDSQRVSRYENGRITPSMSPSTTCSSTTPPAGPSTPPTPTSPPGSPTWPSSQKTTAPRCSTCSTPS